MIENKLETHSEHETRSRLDELIFYLKAKFFQAKRAWKNFHGGLERHSKGSSAGFNFLWAESTSALWSDVAPSEHYLQLGKIQNLRLAVRRLHCVEVPAGQIFSFWRQIGRATKFKGYTLGREIRGGCVVPSVGGGLCQLSNALYDAALQAGMDIVERHAHSKIIAGSINTPQRDATIFWNYVDLRFRAHHAFRIEISLTRDHLIVRFRGKMANNSVPLNAPPVQRGTIEIDQHSCGNCEVTSCYQSVPRSQARAHVQSRKGAFVLDDYWPEFDAFIQATRKQSDVLLIPINGRRMRIPRYAWDTDGFNDIKTATLPTCWRSIASRSSRDSAANRLGAQLKASASLAARLGNSLASNVSHVYVAQSLLPFLWKEGFLGGRSFDVFLTRLPLSDLHRRLDEASRVSPASPTLSEYRAPTWIVNAEAEALLAADHVVTPHREYAALFTGKVVPLEWTLPKIGTRKSAGKAILFPGPTVARKGAHLLRDLARAHHLEVFLSGSELEGADFWAGINVKHVLRNSFEGIAAVVQPALIETQPRSLLAAVSAGIPVIATEACGISGMPGVITIKPDADELLKAWRTISAL